MSQLTSHYFRWFYTAITRTAGHLYLLDPPHHTPSSDVKRVADPGAGLTHRIGTPRSAPAPVTGTAQGSTPDLHGDQDALGIPESATFLRTLLAAVRKRIDPMAIVIDSIQHHQYLEAYVFKRGVEVARVNIGYSARCKVTHVVAPILSELGSELVNLLDSLKGEQLDSGATGPERRQ